MNAPEKLVDSEKAFERAAQEHSSSALHPYFVLHQADALVQQGKLKVALILFDKALTEMPNKQPLYYVFALKRALVKNDTDDAALQKQGREELEALSKDGANPLQDMALYYSGLDASLRNEKELADKKFQEIIAHGKDDSYWYQQAQTRVKSGV
jgi:predicted Zn-dependent protease